MPATEGRETAWKASRLTHQTPSPSPQVLCEQRSPCQNLALRCEQRALPFLLPARAPFFSCSAAMMCLMMQDPLLAHQESPSCRWGLVRDTRFLTPRSALATAPLFCYFWLKCCRSSFGKKKGINNNFCCSCFSFLGCSHAPVQCKLCSGKSCFIQGSRAIPSCTPDTSHGAKQNSIKDCTLLTQG